MGWFGKAVKGAGQIFNDFPIIGDVIGGVADALGQSSANKQNQKMAREQMAFQERMSSTEIQRRTQDLLNAGMNPMLAYSQGGASSAQGARTEIQSPLSKGVGTAMAMRQQHMQMEQMSLQNRLLHEQRLKTQAETDLTYNTADKVQQESYNTEYSRMEIVNRIKQQGITNAISAQELRTKQLTNQQLERLQPVEYAIRQIDRETARLGLEGAERDAEVAKQLGTSPAWIRAAREALGLTTEITDRLPTRNTRRRR